MMTPEEFAEKMKKLSELSFEFEGRIFEDTEGAHCGMDNLMCHVLRELGYGEGIDIFRQTKKWYA